MVCKSSLFLSWLLHKKVKGKMCIYVTTLIYLTSTFHHLKFYFQSYVRVCYYFTTCTCQWFTSVFTTNKMTTTIYMYKLYYHNIILFYSCDLSVYITWFNYKIQINWVLLKIDIYKPYVTKNRLQDPLYNISNFLLDFYMENFCQLKLSLNSYFC